ncbi:hypothetical protein WICMUC_003692 [Wickerhamomyces mucosus]|uniref:Dynein light chain n=1 Tax=Wickerhamomyces mucosus TaxID=1378264 RepID=A0A9P8PJM4_9ASCO|nr:hypothetical protein WICMUC_003692 [Wickerhamomyces mucosus]
MSTDQKPILKAHDISDELQQAIFDLSSKALGQYSVEKDIASFIKKELDQEFGHTWHVVVGEIHAIIAVLLLPPKFSFNSQVSAESLYGGFEIPSDKDRMTLPNVVRLLLIFVPSFILAPVEPVDATLSEPARSTSLKLEFVSLTESSTFDESILNSVVLKCIVKTA